MPGAIYSVLNALGFTHPLHPVLVHITIGSVIGAFVFGLVALIFRKPNLWTTAAHVTVLAFFSSFFTIFMGLMDALQFGWWLVDTIKIKLVLSGVLVLLLFATVIVNRRMKNSAIALVFYTIEVVNVLALGLFGARMVYP